MINRAAVTTVALLLALAACAPATTGGSPSTALGVDSGETVTVIRGNSLYLNYGFGLDDFDLEASQLSGTFWVPEGVNEESANVENRFTLRNVRVPGDWSLELARMRAQRETETRYGRETGDVSYELAAVLRLVVPDDAPLGVTEVTAELAARGGESQLLSIPVRVRAPAQSRSARPQ